MFAGSAMTQAFPRGSPRVSIKESRQASCHRALQSLFLMTGGAPRWPGPAPPGLTQSGRRRARPIQVHALHCPKLLRDLDV